MLRIPPMAVSLGRVAIDGHRGFDPILALVLFIGFPASDRFQQAVALLALGLVLGGIHEA